MTNVKGKNSLESEISSACKQIISNPKVKRITTDRDRLNAVTQAEKNPEMPQGILLDNKKSTTEFYVNRKENIAIELWKSLSTMTIGGVSDKKTLAALRKTGQLIEKKPSKKSVGEYKITMNPGDISFMFFKTTLSEDLSKGLDNKYGIRLLGTKGFIEQSTSTGRTGDEDYNIVLATQDELKTILERAQKLL